MVFSHVAGKGALLRDCAVKAFFGGLLVFQTRSVTAQVNILTYHNDLARTGQNTNEVVLAPANVNSNTFGKLFTYQVDGAVYAQPLYVTGLDIPGIGKRNVVFVATQHNSVYAWDADSNEGPNGGLIWHTSFEPSAASIPFSIWPETGITSTPTIDLDSGVIYVNAATASNGEYFHMLHALNITNGTEMPQSPVVVTANISGNGTGSTNGILSFDAIHHVQRAALTLSRGIVYVAFASYGDHNPYHGWIIGFNATNLAPMANYVFNTTPNSTTEEYGDFAGEGGIWMSGGGLPVDADGNLYIATGNGVFDADQPDGTEYGNSIVKLSTRNGLSVVDYFTPHNQDHLDSDDLDLGSGGVLLLPESEGTSGHRHLLVGGGKEGILYVLDRDNMGKFQEESDSQIVQEFGAGGPAFGTPAYFNHRLYQQYGFDFLKSFRISQGQLDPNPEFLAPTNYIFPGATPQISANGTNNGIVWVIQADGYAGNNPAILHAYDANNVSQELYNSSQAGTRDTAGVAVKFSVPTIANGKVYVGGDGSLTVYSNGRFTSPPIINPANHSFNDSVTVTIDNTAQFATVYFTVDGSIPTTNSVRYNGPFALTNTAVVKARAFRPNSNPSPVTSAAFGLIACPYERAVLAASPIAYWRLNETTQDQARDYCGGFHGTYGANSIPGRSGPQSDAFPGFEMNNRAAEFVPFTPFSYVMVPGLNLNTDSVTITAWAFPKGQQAAYAAIFVASGGAVPGLGYTLEDQLGYIWNGNSTWTFESGLGVTANQWSFLAVAVGPDQATLYAYDSGGLRCATNMVPHFPELWESSVLIGDGGDDFNRVFSGLIDEVAVFNYTLSATQIQDLYAAATGVQLNIQRAGSDLILEWPAGFLYYSDSATGPWQPLSVSSPFKITNSLKQRFFRVGLVKP